MTQSQFDVQEKSLDAITIAGIRMKGRYSECGKAFGQLYKSLGRFINGAPFLLHYDSEYKEDDADFEACVPLRQTPKIADISFRDLPAARCVSLLHRGPYDKLGPSYAKVLKYIKDRNYTIAIPTREVYIKGPGMIFRGNPKNYLTEIHMPIQSDG